MSLISRAKVSLLLALGKDKSAEEEAIQGMVDDIEAHTMKMFNRMAHGELTCHDKHFCLQDLTTCWKYPSDDLDANTHLLDPVRAASLHLMTIADIKGVSLSVKADNQFKGVPIGVTVTIRPKKIAPI